MQDNKTPEQIAATRAARAKWQREYRAKHPDGNNKTMTPDQITAAREARAKWAREYRKKHPEKNKEAIARYWARRAAREAAQEEQASAEA